MKTQQFQPAEKMVNNNPFTRSSIMSDTINPAGQQQNWLHMKTKLIQNFVLVTLTLLLTLGLTQTTYASVTGPGPSWLFVRQITLSPVTPSANFQVKVTLVAGQYTNMNAFGNDLRFYDINNNSCNYWIETWNTGGNSTIWVKVPTSGAAALYMYYGNSSASAASNGANVFDFFDDFTTWSGSWSVSTAGTGSSVTQSGSVVTLTCGGPGQTGAASISSAFTPSPTPSPASFLIETKHKEGAYSRNRFYAGTSLFSGSPLGFEYGYFNQSVTGPQSTALVYWNGFQSTPTLTQNTDYLTQWGITDGSTYNWNLYSYPAGTLLDTKGATTASTIRFITISVTEDAGTSTIVDWVRVRKFTATEPVATVGSQLSNISASITAQTNVLLCNGQSTGAATVTATGGATPYSYSWSPSGGTSATASSLAAGTYTVTVTDNIGLTATASVTITQPATVGGSISSQTNALCNGQSTGSVTVTGSGGVSPYTYALDAGTYGASGTFSSLAASVYTVHVKDANGCIFDQAVTITQLVTVIASVTSQSNITCFAANDGTITVSASGGTGPYTFSVDNGSTWLPATGTDLRLFTGLLPNNPYTIKVKDNYGCISK